MLIAAFYLGYSLALSGVKFTLEHSQKTLEKPVEPVKIEEDDSLVDEHMDEDRYIAMGNTEFYTRRDFYPKESE
jgi:hypothetical protein